VSNSIDASKVNHLNNRSSPSHSLARLYVDWLEKKSPACLKAVNAAEEPSLPLNNEPYQGKAPVHHKTTNAADGTASKR
jgi:hypothetical protein